MISAVPTGLILFRYFPSTEVLGYFQSPLTGLKSN